jgi:uncharacterized protein YndB with AHSA1/START domain
MDRSSFEPSPLAQAGQEFHDDKWTLVFVRDFAHPPEKVWAALTEPGQLSQWAPFTTDRDLGTQGAATLTMIDGDATEDMAAQVMRAEPPRLLEYTWGDDLLRWELEPAGPGTRLTLRHTVQGREWLPKVAAGWHLCLDVAQHLLDGDPVGPIRGADAVHFGWNELNDAYEREFKERES